jgi:MoaA/NifB/PqqE/SkfB family radical SAM enzyme
MNKNIFTHPCFSGCAADWGGNKNARIHLPVAPKCNIQCNYCLRKYDCINESRPGITAKVLSPEEALGRYRLVRKMLPNLTVVGIAGPGDALANFEAVSKTLRLIRNEDPDITFCISTNGLYLPKYAEALANLGVSHLTETINTLDLKTASRIYKFADYEGKRYILKDGAALLLEKQSEGLAKAISLGLSCKVNMVMIKGLNDGEIPALVRHVKKLGASLSNIMQLIPVPGTLFESIPMVSRRELDEMRKQCESVLPQMYNCRHCRADAIGTLDADISRRFMDEAPDYRQGKEAAELPVSRDKTFRFAVSSRSGELVDEHFGHAAAFSIYEVKDGAMLFIGKRNVAQFCGGSCGEHHGLIDGIIKTVSDCTGVITMQIGEYPRLELENRGIKIFRSYDFIENAVREAADRLETYL